MEIQFRPSTLSDLGVCCEDERWIYIPGYEPFYMVSSCGRFATCRARGGRPRVENRVGPWKLLKTYATKVHKGHSCRLVYLRNGDARPVITAHKLVYTSFIGPVPEKLVIDHINHSSYDNHLVNLRVATQAQNQINTKHRNSGVRKLPNGTYRAKITVQGQELWLGTYPTHEEAYTVRREAEIKHYGEFSNKL